MTDHLLNQKIIKLRIAEMAARDQVVAQLREVESRKLWKILGFKSLTDFCEKELGYSSAETRELLIEMGMILTNEQLNVEDPIIQGRLVRLKTWRKNVSATQGLPAYRVLTNKTLMAVASQNPQSREDLIKISGIGPKKVEHFGDAILEHLKSEDRART